ncbi:MAG TPA: tetratricopeptide repeat protein [Methylomirabilota bacterium]|jgi:tol-pal system protein YbgF|nr:tetratricopeptide repeat protein [Methylomirabilota bacterium]
MAGVAAILTATLAGGCGLGMSAKPGDETKAPPDSPVAVRQEMDLLRADLAEIRTRVEGVQRANTEHADRVAKETRAEFDAVQKAMEASSRHDLQRQVEVLDAQSRRIDLLERRTAELGQALRRVELSLTGLENQLTRVLDSAATPSPAARGGAPARPPAASAGPRAVEEPSPAAPPPESSMSGAAAGAGLTPPAMLGPSRNAKSPAAPALPKAEPSGQPRADAAPTATPRTDAPREAKAAPPGRPAPDDVARVAKAAPPAEAKPTAPEPSAGATPPRSVKPSASAAGPATGSPSARGLFDRAMESWNKGEHGQAVLDFEELVQKFPSDPLAASAQFRIGEAYYAARDFERAALEYRKAVELAPKSKDTPQALLRLGLAYRAQKRESDARQVWNQLVRDFPESDATEEARRALRGR